VTQLNNIKMTIPDPVHPVPHQGGMFDHFPKARELEKAFASLNQAVSEEEKARPRTEIAAILKRMGNVYHRELPELLGICQSQSAQMSDSNLEKAVHVCEIAFHGHRQNEHKPNLNVMLQIAAQALTFIVTLLRHKLSHHEVPFVELHNRFFHFSHAALACLQQLGDKAPKALHEKITANIALYLILERLNLFSMNAATQRSLIRTLLPVMTECDVYFIPAGVELESINGFWVYQEDRHTVERTSMHGSLAGTSKNDRLVANIFPLIKRLEESTAVGSLVRTGFPEAIKGLIRKKLKALKRREDRVELHESARLLVQWMDVVDLRSDRGVVVSLLEADELGFRLLVEDHNVPLPDIDSFIAVNREGHGVTRGVLIWKRVEARGVLLGGAWIRESFHQTQLSLLGHSEMSVGLRQWHALIRRLDNKQIICWIGERELQPGISVLLPIGKTKYSSTLDRVDHRGGNYCRGILTLGEEWKEVSFELDD